MNHSKMRQRTTFIACVLILATFAHAGKEVFQTPKLGANLGVWRLTNDPTVRDHANYHNTQCFSPDGRYVCYTRWGGDAPGSDATATVHVFDLATNTDHVIDTGNEPRWAKKHNWLFYVTYERRPDSVARNGSAVMWLDMDSGKHIMLADGPENLGETDFDDRWLYAALRFRGQDPEYVQVRIPITDNAVMQEMPQVIGAQRLPNPRYPVFFTRRDHNNDPFLATRFWYDLDGSNQRIGVPTIQKCHMSWLGNGEYMLLGNGLIRGRRWNEPFPSNVHILASVGVGDISPCGTSGRYVCGDDMIADLRSGDGFQFIEPLSIICFPKSVGDASGIYDADPKGSADGTKIAFVSNYDLKDGPVTHITETPDRNDDRIVVESTEGFAPSGRIDVFREVISYRSRTPTSFEGITRGAHDTAMTNIRAGRTVTSFDARSLSDEQWARLPRPSPQMRKTIDNDQSPLLRQRQTDLYIAVVRKPDRPYLRVKDGIVQVIPGESHDEIRGYEVLMGERRIAYGLLKSGALFFLSEPGEYSVAAVEWSGLMSEPSNTLRIDQQTRLRVLDETPDDFSWTADRWLIDDAPVSASAAQRAPKTVREIVHLYDGVIAREWYEGGMISKRHDLNAAEQAIRRVEFADGRLIVREYHTNRNIRVSREIFDTDCYITETIRYDNDDGREIDRWWFERGMPVKQVRRGREYIKRGDRFGRLDGGRFIDLPRAALSD